MVERTTGYALPVPPTDGFKAGQVAPALAAETQTCSAAASVADLGPGREDAGLGQVQIAAEIAIHFCDPHSP